MDARREVRTLIWMIVVFVAAVLLPVSSARFQGAVIESLRLVRWYAREHVLLCLVPAFFIAGAIGVFVSQQAVMRYLGPKANRILSYGVASVTGCILAVCSCTVLPLFGGIYLRGAGLGPAIAFLYSGPAINVLAIVLTARVLGAKLGIARAVGAVVFSVLIGALMHLFFLKEERARAVQAEDGFGGEGEMSGRPLWQTAVYFFSMVAVLIFANWGKPVASHGMYALVSSLKWQITAVFGVVTGVALWRFFGVNAKHLLAAGVVVLLAALAAPAYPVASFTAGVIALTVVISRSTDEMRQWRDQTWGFAKQIAPLLLFGVLAAGFFLGSPESTDAGIVPNRWVQALVGNDPSVFFGYLVGNAKVPGWLRAVWPVWTNLFASVVGALMYFATLTEVPILRGLIDSGMGQGPALALLLAGPALSLPNMLVINSIIGTKKTAAYVGLVVVMATVTGVIFGAIA